MAQKRLKLNFSAFRFVLSPDEVINVPRDKFALLRHSLSAVVRKIACYDPKQQCAHCLLNGTCAFSYIFEFSSSTVEGELQKHPHPFVLEPVLAPKQVYAPGENFTFNLILIGKGIDYLPYFILAVEELGRANFGKDMSKFQLDYVVDVLSEAGGKLIYAGNNKALSHDFTTKTFTTIARETKSMDPVKLRILFLTPTRIKQKQPHLTPNMMEDPERKSRLVRSEFDFSLFIRRLLRRLCWLAEAHCGQERELDFPRLLLKAQDIKTTYQNLSWYDWGRYSSHQRAYLKMGGFTGQITFEGDLGEFLPFIKLGEYLHIGNGTAYGLGKYIMQ